MREIRAKITSRGGTLTLERRGGVRFGAAPRRGVGGVVVVSRRAGRGRKSRGEKVSGKQSPERAAFYRSSQGEWKQQPASQPVGVCIGMPPVFVPQIAPMPKISLSRRHRTRYVPKICCIWCSMWRLPGSFFHSFEMGLPYPWRRNKRWRMK
jgi:hypothetical protein